MGEIRKKIKIISMDNERTDEAIIDTSASRTMIKESLLEEMGAVFTHKELFKYGGEVVKQKNMYAVSLKIDKCRIPAIFVVGGQKSIIGHDILQANHAIIDEKNHRVHFPKCDGIMEM